MKIKNKQIAHADHSFLAEAQQLWLEGEWQKLLDLEPKVSSVQTVNVKTELAGLLASACLQNGDPTNAQDWLDKAHKWGAGQKRLAQILISGVYNSLGRIAALQQRKEKMNQNFAAAIFF